MQNALPMTRHSQNVDRIETPSLAWFFTLALALLALVLPIVGPLDDHHFAERSHAHQHVYLNGFPVNHEHAGIGNRAHPHLDRLNPSPKTSDWTDDTAVMYFTDATASLMLAVMNAPYHKAPEPLRPAPSRVSNDNPLASFAPPHREPNSVKLLPPVRPPIA